MSADLLIDRIRYNQMCVQAGCTDRGAANIRSRGHPFNPKFVASMDHIGILEASGVITLIKDKTYGYKHCSKSQWLEMVVKGLYT